MNHMIMKTSYQDPELPLVVIDPQTEFFKNYGWLEKNSADIWLSRIIVISKKYGWNSADYRYFFLNTAEAVWKYFSEAKSGITMYIGTWKFLKVRSHGPSSRPSGQSLATV